MHHLVWYRILGDNRLRSHIVSKNFACTQMEFRKEIRTYLCSLPEIRQNTGSQNTGTQNTGNQNTGNMADTNRGTRSDRILDPEDMTILSVQSYEHLEAARMIRHYDGEMSAAFYICIPEGSRLRETAGRETTGREATGRKAAGPSMVEIMVSDATSIFSGPESPISVIRWHVPEPLDPDGDSISITFRIRDYSGLCQVAQLEEDYALAAAVSGDASMAGAGILARALGDEMEKEGIEILSYISVDRIPVPEGIRIEMFSANQVVPSNFIEASSSPGPM